MDYSTLSGEALWIRLTNVLYALAFTKKYFLNSPKMCIKSYIQNRKQLKALKKVVLARFHTFSKEIADQIAKLSYKTWGDHTAKGKLVFPKLPTMTYIKTLEGYIPVKWEASNYAKGEQLPSRGIDPPPG